MFEYSTEELTSLVQQVLDVTTDKALLYAQRLKDMDIRKVASAEAEMYLKSAGWYNEDLVALYKELQKMDKEELEETMAKKKEVKKVETDAAETAFPASVTKQLLKEIVDELAEVSGFRLERVNGETESQYYEALKNYIGVIATEASVKSDDTLARCRRLAAELVQELDEL